MKKHYDFSNAVKGKFYVSEAEANIPIYLDSKNQKFVNIQASKLGTSPAKIVNKILRKEIAIVEELELR